MKVLFLNASGGLGGAERCLIDMVASLRHSNRDIEIGLVASDDGPLIEALSRYGVSSTILPLPAAFARFGDSGVKSAGGLCRFAVALPAAAWGAHRYSRTLAKVVADYGPNVIHSNSLKCHILSGRLRRSGTKIIWHLHDFIGGRAVASKLLRWSGLADKAIAVSKAVAIDARQVLPKLSIDIIYNAIDIEQFRPGPSLLKLDELAKMPESPSGAVRVGLVATYARWKGHDVYLDAVGQLSRQIPPGQAVFYIIGGPIYQTQGSQWTRDQILQKAAEAGASCVRLIDFQSEPAEIYRALDIVVHASTRPEPFGRTIVESMGCGKAVIVTAAGGASELFIDKINAVGVSPGNATQLASALKMLIENATLRSQLGTAARGAVVAQFANSRLGIQLLKSWNAS